MRALLNACMVLLILNVAGLFCVYSIGQTGAGKEAAQSLGKLISAYSEPNSNPQFLVRAEDQCRFWDQSYCARALAKRKAVKITNPYNPPMPEELQATALYSAYVDTRSALTQATTEYVAFLDKNPSDVDYIERSKEFEEQASVLIGQLVSYLYDMQNQTIRAQSTATERVLMAQYVALVLLFLIVSILRFRRGGTWYGHD